MWRNGRPSWLGIADAVGHCVLVFAFLPALASLPAWLYFEAGNPLNREDAVALTFVPVRGAILLLHAFRAGVVPGVLAGLVDGVLVCAWVGRRGNPAKRCRDGLPLHGGKLDFDNVARLKGGRFKRQEFPRLAIFPLNYHPAV